MSAGTRLASTPDPMHHWTGAGGIKLAGDAWGGLERPLVILLHGSGQTRHAWKRTGKSLGAAGYHAIAFDARGHGDSDWDRNGDYSQEAMVEDLAHIIDALGNPRPTLIGASMGGGTSLIAIAEGHVDATALVLVDIAPRVDPTGVAAVQAFMAQNPDGFDSLDAVATAIANYQPHRERPRTLDGLAKNVRLGDDGRFRWHWDPRLRAVNESIDLDERQQRLERCAQRLDVPTVLIRGGLSDVLTVDGAQEFLEFCPHAEYVAVPDAAHMVAGDRNDVFADAVIDFLRRTVPPNAPVPELLSETRLPPQPDRRRPAGGTTEEPHR